MLWELISQTGFHGKEITEGEASQGAVAIEAEGWRTGGQENEVCLPVFPLLILCTSLQQNEEFLSYQRQQPAHSFKALELASSSADASGTHEKITPPREPQNSPGQLPRAVRGDLGKLQHWILPILLPWPSLVPSLVLHEGCALIIWFRMSWNTWSHWWPGPTWFLGGSSYRFLKFINSKPCPVFISMSLCLTPSSPSLTSGIILPYTMSSKFSWSFPLMSPLSCLSYKCCSNQSLDSLLLPKIFLKWIPSF